MNVAAGDRLPGLVVGEVLADHARIMTLILDDPNPIHFDLGVVAAAGLGDREVLQGAVTMGYVVSMLGSWAGPGSMIAEIDCRFLANVLVGDRVVAGGVVKEVGADARGRTAVCDVWADRSDGTRVIGGRATVVLDG